jgi:mitochondrial fission protein ELM1
MSATGIAGPSVWVVSDGRMGIERQSLSLARALGATSRWSRLLHIRSDAHRNEPVRLTPSGPQLMLQPDMWPAPLAALPKDQRALLDGPLPDVWIASGRRSIPYSIQVRKRSGGRTLVVQTQNPKVALSHFDLVIPPEHDLVAGPNVFPILGPPTYFPDDEVEEALLRFGDLTTQTGLKLLVSIGGDSKTHRMTADKVSEIEQALQHLAGSGMRLWITVSRRTPEDARRRFRKLAETLGARFWESATVDGPNPYLAFLSLCDAALVTEDSANMLADPAWFGKPTWIMRLEGKSDRFDRLHQGFIQRGAARWFEGKIEPWTYDPVREVERAADEIMRLLLERHKAG